MCCKYRLYSAYDLVILTDKLHNILISPKCSFIREKLRLLTKHLTKTLPQWGDIRGKQILDVLTEWKSFQDSCSSFSLSLSLTHTPVRTHTRARVHTPLPLSFLASDSRHPAMTRGVSLAASKAALNRQKYLLWQTDRPSPSTTCLQLSLFSPLLFPSPLVWLCFMWFSLHPEQCFPPFLLPTAIMYDTNDPSYVWDTALDSCWFMARRGRDRDDQGAWKRSTLYELWPPQV